MTPDGELTCAFGTPWLDHWDPPTGTGRGCAQCESETQRRTDAPLSVESPGPNDCDGRRHIDALSGLADGSVGDVPSGS